MERPNIDQAMLAIAVVLSARATCKKLQVGCVLTDHKGHILSAGYNGVVSGRRHCLSSTVDICSWGCQATHAESNALLSFMGDRILVDTCYTTHSPCMACCKQLIQTGCDRIVFLERSEEHDKARDFWVVKELAGYQRAWVQEEPAFLGTFRC